MDEQFITPSRLKILKEIANEPQSVSEIARKIGMSIPYVLNQTILLEAKGIIKKQILNEGKPGKPKKQYQIVEPIIKTTIISQEITKQYQTINPQKEIIIYYKLLSRINKKKQAEFSKYYWELEEHINKTKSIGLIEINEDKVELLAITSQENLEFLRKKIAHKQIVINKKTTIFVCWVHTEKEILEGIARNDFYYLNLKEKVEAMHDPNELFKQIKE